MATVTLILSYETLHRHYITLRYIFISLTLVGNEAYSINSWHSCLCCTDPKSGRFYRAACNADAVLWGDFCLSVCLSVCLSHAWIV